MEKSATLLPPLLLRETCVYSVPAEQHLNYGSPIIIHKVGVTASLLEAQLVLDSNKTSYHIASRLKSKRLISE